MGEALLVLNAAATLHMCGVVRFVQHVHYPLFERLDPALFREAQRRHQAFTFRVVVGPMAAEFGTALALLAVPPAGVPYWQVAAGAVLAVGWAVSTAVVQVPIHERLLAGGYDRELIRRLVRTNRPRTLVWSARALLVTVMLLECGGHYLRGDGAPPGP